MKKTKMLKTWLVFRYLKQGSKFVSLTSLFSVVGIAIGVACLVLTMSIVNGFMSTIHTSVIDYVGHILIYKQGGIDDLKELKTTLKKEVSKIKEGSAFATKEAMISANGKIFGALLRSQETTTYSSDILKKRLIKGDWFEDSKMDNAIILGKVWQKKLNIKMGDSVKVLISKPQKTSSYQLNSKVKEFIVSGFIDLGKYDYNERIAFIKNSSMQTLIEPERLKPTAYMLWLESDKKEVAEKISINLSQKLSVEYYVKDWFSHNRNFLSAVAYEKYILFLVLSIMIIAACFNVASSLYISVLKRYSDISILRTFGASRKFIQQLFSTQGLVIGFTGLFMGLILGFFLCWYVPLLPFFALPAEVYKIDRLPIEIRFLDLLLIALFTLFLTYLSTLLPAKKGAKMARVKGLNYD